MPARRLYFVAAMLLITSVVLPGARATIPNIRLTTDAASSARPRVALDPSANLVVVWQDGRFGNDEILWQKFDQLGNPLTGVVRVTNTAGASRWPDVSCDPNGVSHIAWQEGENVNSVGAVYFCRLDAAGTKILNDVQVPVTNCGHPQVAALADGSTDLTYFRSSGILDFYTLYNRYSAAGTPVCSKQLGASFTATVLSPSIATSSTGTAFVFWLDIPTSSYQVRAGSVASCGTPSVSTIAGATSTTRTTSAIGGGSVFRMFDAGGNIQNVLGANNVCQISQGSGQASEPSVGADANDGYVVWRDNRDGGNGEIYLARFWGCTNRSGDTRLTNDVAVSVEPDIAVDPSGNGNWATVWRDTRDGNNEIYMTSRVLIDGPTPAQPTGVSAATLPSACPPQVELRWTDASNNETRFEVEMESDGSGVWSAMGSLPPGSTSWTGGTLEYGHTYTFRVRACNGTYCSEFAVSAPVPIDEELRLLEGIVRATVIDRGVGNNPSLQPVPGVRVSVLRNGQAIYSSVPSDGNGRYAIGIASLRCNDSMAVYLLNDYDVVEDRGGAANYCLSTPATYKVFPVPTGSTFDLEWPVEADGFSGEAVNAHYWNERALADYWQGQLALGLADREVLHTLVRFPRAGGGYQLDCEPQYDVTWLGSKSAYCRSAIVHELAHSMLHHNACLAQLAPSAHQAAAPIDEALADYFTAAWSGDTEILPWGWVGDIPVAYRNITSRRMMPACNGAYVYSGNKYGDALVLSGTLWDWRKRLVEERLVPGAEVDQAVFQAVRAICSAPPAERDFLAFRNALATSAASIGFPDDLTWAFDRHNIKDPPDDTCPHIPVLWSTRNDVDPAGRHVGLAWTSVPEAVAYRIYAERTPGGFTSVGLGEVVADSLVGTTFSYLEPDTSTALSFMVVVLDSIGEGSAAGVRVFTAVDDAPRLPGGIRFSVRNAFPNPFGSTTGIRYELPEDAKVTARVFDASGRLVRAIPVGRERAGSHRIVWDGRTGSGQRAATGIYFIQVQGGDHSASTRVVLLR